MPTKNSVKSYLANGVYHIYNRGVEKRKIFLDKHDYNIFLYYLKSYLTPKEMQDNPPSSIKRLRNFSLFSEIKLLAYVLMPTHFHLMIKQFTEKAMIEFMKRLSNGYVEYFNKRYQRVGALFQGRYKAALVTENNHFLHLTRYIHLNPIESTNLKQHFTKLHTYPYSSYPDYLGKRNSNWLDIDFVLNSIRDQLNLTSYQEFVEQYEIESREFLNEICLDL